MKVLKHFWRTILLIAIILTVSLANMNKVLPDDIITFKYFDKIAHLCMYTSLSFIFFIENYSSNNILKRRWIILETISFGIFIEFLQFLLTNNRTADFYDVIFNTVGVLIGGFFFVIFRNYKFIYKILLMPLPYSI